MITILSMTNLWKHQLQALEYLRQHNWGMLMMGVGTGKTRTTLEFIQEKKFRNVLIVGTKNGTSIWQEQVKQFGFPFMVHTFNTGTVKDRAHQMLDVFRDTTNPITLFVVNYEAFVKKVMIGRLTKIKWDAIIFDEVHKLRNAMTKQSKLAYTLARMNPNAYRLGLTGTLIYHKPLDVFGIFRFINSDLFGTNWSAFKYRYAIWGGNYQIQFPVSHINTQELSDIVVRNSFIVDRRQVLDLPYEQHLQRTTQFEKSEIRSYAEFNKEYVTTLSQKVTAKTILDKVNKLQQLTAGFIYQGKEVVQFSKAKQHLLEETLEEIGDQNVVIFYRFAEEAIIISEACSSQNIPHFFINGNVSQYQLWRDYGDGASIVIVQIQSGSESIDFTKAGVMIFYSMIYTFGQYEQALGRISRGDAKKIYKRDHVLYYYLMIKDSIDEKIFKALMDGKDLVEEILSGSNGLLAS